MNINMDTELRLLSQKNLSENLCASFQNSSWSGALSLLLTSFWILETIEDENAYFFIEKLHFLLSVGNNDPYRGRLINHGAFKSYADVISTGSQSL